MVLYWLPYISLIPPGLFGYSSLLAEALVLLDLLGHCPRLGVCSLPLAAVRAFLSTSQTTRAATSRTPPGIAGEPTSAFSRRVRPVGGVAVARLIILCPSSIIYPARALLRGAVGGGAAEEPTIR
jgi:hypothetical protein